MGKIKKYQMGGDTTRIKGNPFMKARQIDSLRGKSTPPVKKTLKKDVDLSAPGKGMIEELKKKGPMPASKKNIGRKGIKVGKAKNGKSFPDLNKDGKITKADILKGRGVIRNGGKMKKARGGATLSPSKKSTSNRLSSYGRVIGKNMSKMRMGGSMKKCRGGCY